MGSHSPGSLNLPSLPTRPEDIVRPNHVRLALACALGSSIRPGVYFARMEAGPQRLVQRIVVLP